MGPLVSGLRTIDPQTMGLLISDPATMDLLVSDHATIAPCLNGQARRAAAGAAGGGGWRRVGRRGGGRHNSPLPRWANPLYASQRDAVGAWRRLASSIAASGRKKQCHGAWSI